MDFLEGIQTVIKVGTEIFQAISPILTIITIVFIVGTKIRKVLREAKMSKEELWKDKMVRRLLSSLGTGEIMDIIIIITELMRLIPAEELHATIIGYYKEKQVEVDMAEAMDNLSILLRLEKEVKTNPVFSAITTLKDKMQMVEIKNRKRWNRLRREIDIDKALENAVMYRWRDRVARIKSVRQKSRIAEIEEKVATLTSEQNILRNRRMRHAIEHMTQKHRDEEEKKRLDKIQKELYEWFTASTRPENSK